MAPGSLSASLTNEAGNGETETITETWICVTEPPTEPGDARRAVPV